jgi:hypothetical protein
MTTDIDSITITYGDQAENHKGMQIIGHLAEKGFNHQDLLNAKKNFEKLGSICELLDLRDSVKDEQIKINLDPAYVLIIRNGVNSILKDIEKNSDDMYNEQKILNVDKKAKMYGRVVNKHARHNLCFSNENQEPDYENGKGRIVSFDTVPLTNYVRNKIPEIIGDIGNNLQAEGNYYYDSNKCGIGYHGDSERLKVIAVRLGKTIPLCFLWFYKNKYVDGITYISDLKNGDMYIMSEKATGNDWKKKNIYTLRHSAGCGKYINLPVPYTINY